jgi:hypothetical protein
LAHLADIEQNFKQKRKLTELIPTPGLLLAIENSLMVNPGADGGPARQTTKKSQQYKKNPGF